MNQTDQWLEEQKRRVLTRDEDRVYLNTGPERVGKTNTSFWLGKRLDDTFDHTRMVFAADALMALALKVPKGSCIVLDEAITGGFSRDALKNQNKSFVKFLVVAGERNLHTIINFPNIRFLDPYLRHHRAHFWLLGQSRGTALLHRRRRADYEGAKTSWPKMWGISNIPDCSAVWKDEWEQYLEAKSAAVREVGESADEETYRPSDREVERYAQKWQMLLQEA